MSGLEGKIVVVTGAGRGLGAAFATSLAMAGCRLILCGRRMGDLETVGRAVTRLSGHHPDLVTLDLADAPSVRDAVKQIEARLSHVDILINNAAMWLESSTEPYEDKAVLQVINSAIAGTFLFTQGLRSLMEASEAPDVVTIGSISGLPNAALQSVSVPFYAAKHGQTALAEASGRPSRARTFARSSSIPPISMMSSQTTPTGRPPVKGRKGRGGLAAM